MSRLSELFKLSILSVLLCFCLTLQASVPKGWLLSGSRPADYETGLDPRVVFNSHQSAYLRSVNSDAPGFGTLMQSISAERYLGKRVRLTAFIKAENVEDWAGLWMRVDRGNVLAVAFDNMHERAIKGSVDWKSYAVVLDVPQNATVIAFGTLLAGTGNLWISAVNIEIIGDNVVPTSSRLSDIPVNLNFDK